MENLLLMFCRTWGHYFNLLCQFMTSCFRVLFSANEHWIEQTCDSPMASTSTPGTLSTSGTSSTQNLTCEVFLSFRGEDTRHGFTSHLYEALTSMLIDAFREEENLEKGEEIHPNLKKAIEKSQYAVVIISEKFGNSKSCLIELNEIMERQRKGCLNVFPVFYHVEPSDVRHQTGMFGKHFNQFGNEKGSAVDTAKWNRWTAALKEVGELKGWHVQNSDEAKIVKEIGLQILRGLIAKPKDISASFYGIEIPVEDIMNMLRLESGGVHFIGICGIGGIGKSTLAEVVRAKASPKFRASCFIDVGKKNVSELRKELVFQLLSRKVSELLITEGDVQAALESRLTEKKVLIVLDDLHEREKLKTLAKAEWFGDGSRIIITSRDRKWPCLDKDSIYDVGTLTGRPALELFCSNAFLKGDPREEFWDLVEDLVNLAKGLPLALEVYGSHVKGEGKSYWEGYRDDLKKNVDEDVKGCLQLTFDRLKPQFRDAFLDIVCFFIGRWGCLDRDNLKEKLVCLGHSSNILIDLENKSLLKFVKHEMMIVEESLSIHDLLLQMGEKIVDKERMWRDQDIVSELQENSEKIEIDKLKVLWLQASSIDGDEHIKICLGAFSKMKNLRIIYIPASINKIDLCGEYSKLKLSNELRYLYWYGYPFESLPTGFIPTNLIVLYLNNCSIKRLWNGNESFSKLKNIDLEFSKALEETPEFNSVPNLESLNLSYCTNLSVIHPSIGHLKHLKELNLSNCSRLEQLPDIITSTSLEVLNLQQCLELKGLPNEIKSKSLKYLNLSSCPKVENLPAILGKIPSLQYINISRDAIKEFPFSFQKLPFLEEFHANWTRIGGFQVDIVFSKKQGVFTCAFYGSNSSLGLPPHLSSLKRQILLDVIPWDEVESSHSGLFECSHDGYKELLEAPFSSLKSLLDVSWINCNLEAIPKCSGYWVISRLDLSKNKIIELPNGIGKLSNLKVLTLDDCTSLGALPNSMCELFNLEGLHLNNCTSLGALPTGMCKLSSLKELHLSGCTSLRALPNSICELSNLEGLYLSNCTFLGALPNRMCKLSSLEELYLDGCTSLEALPNSMCEFSSLKELYLNGCTSLGALPKLPESLSSLELKNCPSLKLESLMHGLICYSSIAELNLSNNRFRELPDNLCELSKLECLDLNDCTSLQTLPKLPLSLKSLRLFNCPLLLTIVLSSMVTNIGFDCKPHMILNPNPYIHDPTNMMPMDDKEFHERRVVCGPLLRPRIPKWFIHTSTGSNKTIQIHMGWNTAYDSFEVHRSIDASSDSPNSCYSPEASGDSTDAASDIPDSDACALLITYEVCGNDKPKSRKRRSGEPENSAISACESSIRIFPEFVCRLQCKGVNSQVTFTIRVPEVARIGSHGVWVFICIPPSMRGQNYLASITTSSENMKLRESAGRLLKLETDRWDFIKVAGNHSRPDLDPESIEDALNNYLRVIS